MTTVGTCCRERAIIALCTFLQYCIENKIVETRKVLEYFYMHDVNKDYSNSDLERARKQIFLNYNQWIETNNFT